MLTATAFVPGAPLLVPALAGPAATDVVELRTAVIAVARRLADSAQRWVAVGVGEVDTVDARHGTFAGFGVDERVSLDPVGPHDFDAPVSAPMSVPMLVAGWIRGQVAPEVTVCPNLLDVSTDPADCVRLGADIGARVEAADTAVGLLVIADGSFGLSAGAPGGAIPGAGAVQDRIDAAVATGDLDTIDALTVGESAQMGIAGRPSWQVAASIWRGAVGESPRAESSYCAAPFGVGYQVAWWGR